MTAADLQVKRKELGIRQDVLADKLGWNTETIIDIERGRVVVSDYSLAKIDSAIEMIQSETREEVTA